VVDEFYGLDIAWKIAFPIVVMLIFYLYFVYNQAFVWNLFFCFMFMGVGLIASFAPLFFSASLLQSLSDKIIVSLFLIVFLLFRGKIQKYISSKMPSFIPMSNNFDEVYRVIWVLFVVLLVYITTDITMGLLLNLPDSVYFEELSNLFVALVVSFSLYEILRINLIRRHLEGEEWWPIVNNSGKIVGSVEHFTSLTEKKKFQHPMARVMIIDKSRILLQRKPADDLVAPSMWDTTMSNHVRMIETIEACVERTAKDYFQVDDFKYMHLSNYACENKYELQYAFLFVSCQISEIKPRPTDSHPTKWWTQRQIEENLHSGIFSENFLIEYDLIKRSGLLETGKCNCNCGLKQAILSYSGVYKKY
jgi:isopentenyldiphosphate isomerase